MWLHVYRWQSYIPLISIYFYQPTTVQHCTVITTKPSDKQIWTHTQNQHCNVCPLLTLSLSFNLSWSLSSLSPDNSSDFFSSFHSLFFSPSSPSSLKIQHITQLQHLSWYVYLSFYTTSILQKCTPLLTNVHPYSQMYTPTHRCTYTGNITF
jgi:hypothetical protein